MKIILKHKTAPISKSAPTTPTQGPKCVLSVPSATNAPTAFLNYDGNIMYSNQNMVDFDDSDDDNVTFMRIIDSEQ